MQKTLPCSSYADKDVRTTPNLLKVHKLDDIKECQQNQQLVRIESSETIENSDDLIPNCQAPSNSDAPLQTRKCELAPSRTQRFCDFSHDCTIQDTFESSESKK